MGKVKFTTALRAGDWEGLVNGSQTANAPLLICSPVTILGKPCNKQTCLTYYSKTAEKLWNTTLTVSKQHTD